EELAELVRIGVRSVILFARNAEDRNQVTEMIRAIKALSPDPILVCVDQEGGNTVRFESGFSPPPSMREVGEAGLKRAADVGAELAADLRPVGIDLDLAPVVDVDSNPANPVIGPRSFGRDSDHVGVCGAALIESMQAGGVAACAKHFPGHGDTAEDSHLALPRLSHDRSRLDRVELPPFQAAIAADVASIMISHVLYDALDPDVPSTLSRRVVTGLLREELGFEGVIVSDDLQMQAIADQYEVGKAAVAAVRAGIDMVLCCHDFDRQLASIDAIIGAMDSGQLEVSRVQESVARLDRLYDRYVREP
ncbi:MAG: beta-N-acetylhexosaminidase, partial [Phycisphaerales bacterium]|nr:beta-N-acetylhexosaminidase [Phycisphaerales bacterium]